MEWLMTPPPRASSPLNPATSPSASRPSFALVGEQLQNKRVTVARREVREGAAHRWVKWMGKYNMKELIVPISILGSAMIKWSIGMGSYSGQAKPPMHGDYEAQRHWMEITTHLPTSQWYTYDLPYWGLDYPPLTAYHSWLCGKIGSFINSSWFALDSSRGFESEESKVFMRSTVLVSDLLIYVPAILGLVKIWNGGRSSRTRHVALLTLLFHPALLMIDFGHFQYNSVMLGFAIHSLNAFATNHDTLGCICFVLALGFKQMALYYAPVIGAYLLGKCLWLSPDKGIRLFNSLALVTLSAFALLFLPFLNTTSLSQVFTRIFPFNRGLFEDKVANFWCASDVVFKWRNIRWLGRNGLVRLSAILTVLGFMPSVYSLIIGAWNRRQTTPDSKSRVPQIKVESSDVQCPTTPLLPYALFTCSMSFFLFSFQVHEKSILLPLMPLTLLLSSATPSSVVWDWGVLVNNVAMFSMYPLLKRDGLGLQYAVVTLMWNRIIGFQLPQLKTVSFINSLSLFSYTSILILHSLEILFSPPPRYPDLFPVLNVLLSTTVFGLCWLWSIKRGVEVSWALGGLVHKSQTHTSNNHMNTRPKGKLKQS